MNLRFSEIYNHLRLKPDVSPMQLSELNSNDTRNTFIFNKLQEISLNKVDSNVCLYTDASVSNPYNRSDNGTASGGFVLDYGGDLLCGSMEIYRITNYEAQSILGSKFNTNRLASLRTAYAEWKVIENFLDMINEMIDHIKPMESIKKFIIYTDSRNIEEAYLALLNDYIYYEADAVVNYLMLEIAPFLNNIEIYHVKAHQFDNCAIMSIPEIERYNRLADELCDNLYNINGTLICKDYRMVLFRVNIGY